MATSTAKGGHIGVDLFLRFLPEQVRPYVVHASRWILFLVSVGLVVSSYDLAGRAIVNHGDRFAADNLRHSGADWFAGYDGGGAGACLAGAHSGSVLFSGLGIVVLAAIGYMKLSLMADPASAAAGLMLICFVLGILAGVPIAFTLVCRRWCSLSAIRHYRLSFFSQQVCGGGRSLRAVGHSVLPAGRCRDGDQRMSTRLVELIVRGMGRFRGGLNMTTVLSMAFFPGSPAQAGRCCGGWRRADAGGASG